MQREPSCPICGEIDITTKRETHRVDYGSGEHLTELQLPVPVSRCDTCGFEYLEDSAEHLKHIAVCDFPGVLSPEEIRGIRKALGMTQVSFARLTGLGEASLNRWQNGLAIQSYADDRYLRSLAHPVNILRIRELAGAPHSEP